MRTFASVYSGIGGADAGFCAHGWQVKWQCEADHYRSAVLKRGFNVDIYERIESLPTRALETVDLLYGELPDHRLNAWWPMMRRVVEHVKPKWLICECSPSVPCEPVLLDVVRDGWCVRLLYIRCIITSDDMRKDDTDIRNRALIVASRNDDVYKIGVAGNWAELVITTDSIKNCERLSMPWHELSRGFRVGWTCACGVEPCACGRDRRISALADATSPYLSSWIAEVIDGAWQDGVDRGVTEADGRVPA